MKKIKKNEIIKKRNMTKGITLVTLVITIIVLIIITSVSIYTGNGIIKQASLQTINTNMMLIQAKTKTIAEQAKFNNDTSNYKGTKLTEITGNSLIDKLISDQIITDKENYYLLTQTDLNEMGLEKIKIEQGYVVNYDTNEIIYVNGFETKGETYYKLSEMKNLKIEVEE